MKQINPESPPTTRSPQTSRRVMLRRIMGILLMHRGLIVGASVLSLALAVIWLVPPFLISVIIDRGILGGDSRLLVVLACLLVGVAILIGVVDTVHGYCVVLLSERVVRSLRIMLFNSLQRQSYRFFLRHSSGEVMSRLWNDLSGIQLAVGTAVAELLGAVIFLAVVLLFMVAWNWQLTVFAILTSPLVFGVSYYAGKLNHTLTARLYGKLESLTAFTADRLNISGFIVMRGLGYDVNIDSKRFAKQTGELQQLAVKQTMASRAPIIALAVFPVLASSFIYIYGGAKVIDGAITLGTLTAFTTLSMRLSTPIGNLAGLYVNSLGSLALFSRIFQWIDLPLETTDAVNAQNLNNPSGQVSFRHVSFEYEIGVPTIQNLSFSIEPGQLVALVGPSGAGKTTVTNLILRLCDPTSGAIEIDGRELRQIRVSSLRQFMALVPQECVVFNTTIRENLLIAKPTATEEDLAESCNLASFQAFVDSLPHGYDTVVGELGYRLSGGERQRLAIARAILKRPKILVMDEPTSSLDSITERAIRDVLSDTLTETTTVVVAHRLSTILNSDLIIVLNEGKCIDMGQHKELLTRCDLYRRLSQEQFIVQDVK